MRSIASFLNAFLAHKTCKAIRLLFDEASLTKEQRQEENLWAKATELLTNEDQQQIRSSETGKLDALKDILVIIREKQALSNQKQWKLKRKDGREIVLRDVFNKITDSIVKFKEVGDVLVQYDPAHTAIPWAVVRFVLQVRDKIPIECKSAGTQVRKPGVQVPTRLNDHNRQPSTKARRIQPCSRVLSAFHVSLLDTHLSKPCICQDIRSWKSNYVMP